jgi:hypothetical protein
MAGGLLLISPYDKSRKLNINNAFEKRLPMLTFFFVVLEWHHPKFVGYQGRPLTLSDRGRGWGGTICPDESKVAVHSVLKTVKLFQDFSYPYGAKKNHKSSMAPIKKVGQEKNEKNIFAPHFFKNWLLNRKFE